MKCLLHTDHQEYKLTLLFCNLGTLSVIGWLHQLRLTGDQTQRFSHNVNKKYSPYPSLVNTWKRNEMPATLNSGRTWHFQDMRYLWWAKEQCHEQSVNLPYQSNNARLKELPILHIQLVALSQAHQDILQNLTKMVPPSNRFPLRKNTHEEQVRISKTERWSALQIPVLWLQQQQASPGSNRRAPAAWTPVSPVSLILYMTLSLKLITGEWGHRGLQNIGPLHAKCSGDAYHNASCFGMTDLDSTERMSWLVDCHQAGIAETAKWMNRNTTMAPHSTSQTPPELQPSKPAAQPPGFIWEGRHGEAGPGGCSHHGVAGTGRSLSSVGLAHQLRGLKLPQSNYQAHSCVGFTSRHIRIQVHVLKPISMAPGNTICHNPNTL